MAWIKVEVHLSDTHEMAGFPGVVVHVRMPTMYRIFCRQCGHDDYRKNWDDAMWRAQQMYWDHIPYSPDGSLHCYDWRVSGD